MSEEPEETNANELQAFVTATLNAIFAGVESAQREGSVRSTLNTGHYEFKPPSAISFDVAVTAKHTGSARGGMKIQVFSIGAHAGGDVSSEASTVSRIQFVVPTVFRRDSR